MWFNRTLLTRRLRPATVLCVTYRTPCTTQHVTYHTLDLPLSYASRVVHLAPPSTSRSTSHTTHTRPILCVMYRTPCTTHHVTYHILDLPLSYASRIVHLVPPNTRRSFNEILWTQNMQSFVKRTHSHRTFSFWNKDYFRISLSIAAPSYCQECLLLNLRLP